MPYTQNSAACLMRVPRQSPAIQACAMMVRVSLYRAGMGCLWRACPMKTVLGVVLVYPPSVISADFPAASTSNSPVASLADLRRGCCCYSHDGFHYRMQMINVYKNTVAIPCRPCGPFVFRVRCSRWRCRTCMLRRAPRSAPFRALRRHDYPRPGCAYVREWQVAGAQMGVDTVWRDPNKNPIRGQRVVMSTEVYNSLS